MAAANTNGKFVPYQDMMRHLKGLQQGFLHWQKRGSESIPEPMRKVISGWDFDAAITQLGSAEGKQAYNQTRGAQATVAVKRSSAATKKPAARKRVR